MTLRWTLAGTEEGGALFPDERAAERHVGKGAYEGMEFLHVNAHTIINTVPEASLVPFRYTINPYRGCSHACVYCFARPTHDYLGLGMGKDFERKIVVKVNAVERLRAELRSPRWQGDPIAMGTNTDPYQHAEGKYHLTRGIVETLSGARNPFSILTKSTLIQRDAALLAAACARTEVSIAFSVGTLDRGVWRLTEPGTPPPDRRVEALRRLTAMGIPCGVLVAPVLPGLSDTEDQLTEVVQACAEAGAAVGSAARHSISVVRSGSTTSTGSNAPGPIWSVCTGPASDAVPTSPKPTGSGSSGSSLRRRGRAESADGTARRARARTEAPPRSVSPRSVTGSEEPAAQLRLL